MIRTSGKFIDAAWTRTATSDGPISDSGHSLTSSPFSPVRAVQTTAVVIVVLHLSPRPSFRRFLTEDAQSILGNGRDEFPHAGQSLVGALSVGVSVVQLLHDDARTPTRKGQVPGKAAHVRTTAHRVALDCLIIAQYP